MSLFKNGIVLLVTSLWMGRISATEWPGYYKCDDLVPPLCDDDLVISTGSVVTLPGLQVKYWRYSHAKATKPPIIVVNGGPGLPHNFAKPTRNLACDGREVILYDQAGCGSSRANSSEYPEILNIDYFAEVELPKLIDALGIVDYHILGSSWGTQVAFQYAISGPRMKEGLRSMILNAPIADNNKFVQYQWNPQSGSMRSLPSYIQQRIRSFNVSRDFGSPEFQTLQNIVMSSFVARLGVLVDCWTETMDAGPNFELGGLIEGDADYFLPSGHMTNWTVLPYLKRIVDLPIQLNYGGHDMVSPKLIADTVVDLKASECHEFPTAGHSVMLDEPSELYPKMKDFLVRVEDANGFHPNGECPGKPLLSSKRVYTVNPSHDYTVIVLSCLVSFGLGICIGMNRQKRYGYLAVGR